MVRVRSAVDQVVFMIPMILLLVDSQCQARPRRRFCENYPFAPRCLGVAAKRSLSRTDIYKSLINKILTESFDETAPRDPGLTSTQTDMYDDRTVALNKLANIFLASEHKHDTRKAFIDPDVTWSEQFDEYENTRGV